MMPMPNSIDSALSSSFNTDYQGFKTDVYFRLDLIETTKQNLMVRWVRRYHAGFSSLVGDDDDAPVPTDGGDDDDDTMIE
jgi:hypothetical protein